MPKLKIIHHWASGDEPERIVEVHPKDFEWYQSFTDEEMGMEIIDSIDFHINPFRTLSDKYRGVTWEFIE